MKPEEKAMNWFKELRNINDLPNSMRTTLKIALEEQAKQIFEGIEKKSMGHELLELRMINNFDDIKKKWMKE